MSVSLWLVRHGATDWSEVGRFNGWTDVPLNERGRAQARSLAPLLPRSDLAGVWSSDLVRAVETARLALGDSIPDARLRELDFGRLEGRRWEELEPAVQDALLGFEAFSAPGGESMAGLLQRVTACVDALPEGEHVLFTHGGVIRALLRRSGRDERILPGGVVRLHLG
jgi:2,3-bisphosphoglycerate-dependent phosphoglycerate mutase